MWTTPIKTEWLSVAGVFLLLGAMLGCCMYVQSCWNEIERDAQARKEREAQQERDDQRVYALQQQAAEAAKEAKKRLDAEERSLSPQDRDWRIRDALAGDAGIAGICEAKRLLAKAPDPKVAALKSTVAAIRAVERKELLAERPDFESSRSIVCVDGSGSGCMCHASSHQGCCSHHGGVAGCEPYPTEVSCPLTE